MVNGYLATGDIAPQVLFYNGPAATPYTTARDAFYSWSATPTFQINGTQQVLGWNQSSVNSAIASELALPCYLTIVPYFVGDASGGTVIYSITAEQDLVDTQISFWAAIVESHDIASADYGYYSGMEMMWEPRAFPVGTSGQAVTFTGPYPQTITINGSYTLDPASMTFDNLECIAFVQKNTGDLGVLNASFIDLPDTNTGISGGGSRQAGLEIFPNPSMGPLSISSILPEGESGLVRIFDINGRLMDELPASEAMTTTLGTAGVYFVRLETSSGEVIPRRCTVID
jgi:hypothetical protein